MKTNTLAHIRNAVARRKGTVPTCGVHRDRSGDIQTDRAAERARGTARTLIDVSSRRDRLSPTARVYVLAGLVFTVTTIGLLFQIGRAAVPSSPSRLTLCSYVRMLLVVVSLRGNRARPVLGP